MQFSPLLNCILRGMPGKSYKFNPPVNGMDIYFFHVVTFRLRHIDCIDSPHFRKAIDIVVSPSAEMDGAPIKFIQKALIIRFEPSKSSQTSMGP